MDPFLLHRVDAARRLMRIPARAAEGLGRLYVAKRVQAGGVVEEVLEDVLGSLTDEAARDGARREAETIAKWQRVRGGDGAEGARGS